MAKQHWLMRDEGTDADGGDTPCYYTYAGDKPKKSKSKSGKYRWRGGDWPLRRTCDAGSVRALLHPDFRLEPGGGPMLLGEW